MKEFFTELLSPEGKVSMMRLMSLIALLSAVGGFIFSLIVKSYEPLQDCVYLAGVALGGKALQRIGEKPSPR